METNLWVRFCNILHFLSESCVSRLLCLKGLSGPSGCAGVHALHAHEVALPSRDGELACFM